MKYRKDVGKLTNREEVQKLANFDKVDNHCYNDDAYHIDHIVSVLHCYNNNIHPEVCASIHNLRCIPWRENLSKSSKSDMTINELLERYNAKVKV